MKNKLLGCSCLSLALTAMSFGAVRGESVMSQLSVNQWIQPTAEGAVEGKLRLPKAGDSAVAVADARIVLIDSEGEVTATRTDESGDFRFADVAPGVYTLAARGKADVAAILALHVVSNSSDDDSSLPGMVDIVAGKIDFAAVNSTLIRYLPPSQSEGSSSEAFDELTVSQISQRTGSLDSHRIRQIDGGLVGQIFAAGATAGVLSPSQQANVFLYRDGEEVARLVTEDSGEFRVESLEPGVYAILVVGNSGSGLAGLELIGESSSAFASTDSQTTLVAAQDRGSEQFVMQLAPGDDVVGAMQSMGPGEGEVVSEEVVGEEVVDDGFGVPMGGGGFAGGGGGGAGGGGIGAGGLLGLAGAAAGIVALSIDNDRGIVPPPATPAAP